MTETVQEHIIALDNLVQKAADGIRDSVNQANLDNYINFLNMMYHYTLPSEEKLKQAASKSRDSGLVEFFEHQAKEERGHYLLAEKDLEALGMLPDPQTPVEILNYEVFWNSITSENHTAYVGAVYIFENVAEKLTTEATELIERLELTNVQSRWLRVHLEADLEHGAEAKEIAEEFGDNGPMLEGAEKACDLWIAIFKSAFEGSISLQPTGIAA